MCPKIKKKAHPNKTFLPAFILNLIFLKKMIVAMPNTMNRTTRTPKVSFLNEIPRMNDRVIRGSAENNTHKSVN